MASAKASHAVLLCRMEQGEVTGWSDTEKIDRIRWANAQRHVMPTQASNSSQKFRKSQSGQKKQTSQCPVCITMIILVTFKNITRQKEFSTDIYVVHVLPRMARSMPTLPWIVRQKIQKTINSVHS